MFVYANFAIGEEIGCRDLVIAPELVARWRELFPEDRTGDVMPAGMVAIVTSRAYASILMPRPPGNVHGAQRFELFRLPRIGERVTTALSCAHKEMKGERRWVRFATATADADGNLCFRGEQTVLWAA